MRNALQTTRPDLVRARALLDAMRDSKGKQVRTVEQAVAWLDKTKPEITEAWLAWMGQKAPNKPPVKKVIVPAANPPGLFTR